MNEKELCLPVKSEWHGGWVHLFHVGGKCSVLEGHPVSMCSKKEIANRGG